MSKVKVIEAQGLPHTLTQADGTTLRLFPRQTKVIDEKLVSDEIRAEAKLKYILLIPDNTHQEENKVSKGGTK